MSEGITVCTGLYVVVQELSEGREEDRGRGSLPSARRPAERVRPAVTYIDMYR